MILDILIEIWGVIQRNKLRTAATGFAVTSGIFLLIVLLGAGNGLIHTLEHNQEGLALDAIYVNPGWASKPYAGYDANRPIELFDSDGQLAQRVDVQHILSYTAETRQSVTVVTPDNKSAQWRMVGTSPAFLTNMDYQIKEGRFLNELDMMQHRKVVVICETLVERLFGKDYPCVAQLLKIDGIVFQIVGVLRDNNSNYNTNLLTASTTLNLIYHKSREVSNIVLKAQGLEHTEEYNVFEKVYKRALSLVHHFDPTDERAIWMYGGGSEQETLADAMSAIRTCFWILGLLTLLSGVAGVSNIMLISVQERTHEFGIRRAIGARPWHIILMVILESILITTIFGYIGMVAGLGFCEYMDATAGSQTLDIGIEQIQYFQNPTVGLDVCLQATGVMILAGMVAGFIPARKALRIKPIEALMAR